MLTIITSVLASEVGEPGNAKKGSTLGPPHKHNTILAWYDILHNALSEYNLSYKAVNQEDTFIPFIQGL